MKQFVLSIRALNGHAFQTRAMRFIYQVRSGTRYKRAPEWVSASSVGEGIKAHNALNNFGAGIVAAGGSGNAAGPKAFITVLLYDKNYNFVDVTYKQISPNALQPSTSTKAPDDLMFVDKTVVEPGFAFIYVSNEDPARGLSQS